MKMHQNLPKIRVLSEDQQSVDGEESAGNGRSYSLANPIANPNVKEKAEEPEENGSNRHRLATNDAKQSRHLWSRKLSLNEPKKSADQATTIGSRKHSLREPSPQQQGNGSSSLLIGSPDFHRGSIQSTASSTKAKQFRSRASELIIRIPARQLKRIARAQGIGSLQRETQHFVGITSINGLLRIYRSRGVFRLCWVLVTILSLSVLVWQIYKLCHLYQTRPTVSQVSFLLPENGLPFPAVTICSHNPIRRAYVESLNRTGSFPQQLLNYAMYSFMDPQYLLSLSREGKLTDPQLSDEEWKDFVRYSESKFTVNGFFWNASTSCQQMLKYCSFGGREFDCCAYAKGILTDIGKCYQLSFDDDTDKKWLTMRAGQVQAGINNGLQIIADAHIEEQINSIALWSGHAFADNFENGFRYYVHEQQAMPYLSTEGISVSPGTKVYSAISPTKYFLLSTEEWGNCTHQWPEELQQILDDGGMNLSYTSLKCKTLCQAKFFHDHCGCSPFIFNIEEYYDMCTPYETLVCMNKTTHINHLNNVINASHTFDLLKIFIADNYWPTCTECKIECHRSVYHIYNSYAQGFARSFLNWMAEKNPTWSPGHVRSNFVSINIFYRDISYTEYKQVQSLSMTEILSDIGGNMGLFLGMSLISFIELGTFLCKLTWLFISKQRREHMLAKKCRDEEREKRLQATLEFAAQQRKFASGIGRMMSQVIVPLAGVEAGGGNENVSAGIDGGATAATGIGSFHRRLRRIASNTRPRKWTMTASRSRVAPLNVAGILDATTAPEHAGSPAADASINQPNALDRRRRSNSVFAKLFAPNQRRQSTISVSSEGPKPRQQQQQQRNDFVESVIQSRLHGDAGRAARRKSSTSSSSSSDSSTENANSDAEEEEMTTKERADKLVELKINLDALTHQNSAKAVALVKPIRRPKSAFAMRTRSMDQRQPQQQQSSELGPGVQRRVSTFAHPIQQLLPFASHSQSPTTAGNNLVTRTQSSASAGLLTRNIRGPTIIEAEVEIEGQKSQKRKQSLVNTVAAFFAGTSAAGNGPRQEKRSDPEAPKLSQIAQKYSLASSQ